MWFLSTYIGHVIPIYIHWTHVIPIYIHWTHVILIHIHWTYDSYPHTLDMWFLSTYIGHMWFLSTYIGHMWFPSTYIGHVIPIYIHWTHVIPIYIHWTHVILIHIHWTHVIPIHIHASICKCNIHIINACLLCSTAEYAPNRLFSSATSSLLPSTPSLPLSPPWGYGGYPRGCTMGWPFCSRHVRLLYPLFGPKWERWW